MSLIKPPTEKRQISCDGSVTKNIGADWLNFRTHGHVKKFV